MANCITSWRNGETGSWCFHILAICALRGLVHQLWFSYSSMLFLTNKYKVIKQGVDYKQIDREWNWYSGFFDLLPVSWWAKNLVIALRSLLFSFSYRDNFIILHAFMAAIACHFSTFMDSLPLFNFRGYTYALILHMAITESLYYFIHRMFHSDHLFQNYHSLHHLSAVTQPYTGV